MSRREPEVILPTDDRAARRVKVEGWVSRHGIFFGDDERRARYDGSTHSICEDCGATCDKGRTACPPCIAVRERDRWSARERIPYSGDPIWIGDDYLHDADAVADWLDEYVANGGDPWAVMPMEVVPVYAAELDVDPWIDDLPTEDHEPPDWLIEAVEAANAIIRAHRGTPLSWTEGDRAVDPATLPWPEVGDE